MLASVRLSSEYTGLVPLLAGAELPVRTLAAEPCEVSGEDVGIHVVNLYQ